jgi:hypothetical protein
MTRMHPLGIALGLALAACSATPDGSGSADEAGGAPDRGIRLFAEDASAAISVDALFVLDAGTPEAASDEPADDAPGGRESPPRASDEAPDEPADEPANGRPAEAGASATDCDAATLDEALACPVVANDAFVAAFCDCFTDSARYGGDRAACEADQPGPAAFQPEACAREAMARNEAAARAQSTCQAAAIGRLAGCFEVCPPDEAAFDACFEGLFDGLAACDAALAPALADALETCEGAGVGEPAPGLDGALDALRTQRNLYVRRYCACNAAQAFPDEATCRAAGEDAFDPGLSPCERAAFEADPAAAAPFVTCLTESFLIAETACGSCPALGSIEYDLCADPGFDLRFCFQEAAPALQQALAACPG